MLDALKDWWQARSIIQKVLIGFFLFNLLIFQKYAAVMVSYAGGKAAYIGFYALGWFAFGAFMTFVFLKAVNATNYNRSDVVKASVNKWFGAYTIVSAALIVGWAFDFVAGTALFANLFSLFVAWGVFWWLTKRPAGGGAAAPVNEGPRQANLPTAGKIPTETRPGMDKYSGPAPRPPAEVREPEPVSAPRPAAPRPPRNDEELN